jgi:hypothetical protein
MAAPIVSNSTVYQLIPRKLAFGEVFPKTLGRQSAAMGSLCLGYPIALEREAEPNMQLP